MKVGAREDWLCSAATGKTERRGPFEKGVAVVKTHIVEAIVTAAHASRDEKVKAAAAGRNQLDIPEDSDSSSTSGESDEGRQQAKVDNPLDGAVQIVQYRGFKFKAVLLGRLVYVETRADVAKIIVGACLVWQIESRTLLTPISRIAKSILHSTRVYIQLSGMRSE